MSPNGAGMYNTFYSFLYFALVHLMQPRWSALKDDNQVLVASNPGRLIGILYGLHAARLVSLIIILPIHEFTLICHHIHRDSISMPNRLNAGIHVFAPLPSIKYTAASVRHHEFQILRCIFRAASNVMYLIFIVY